MKIPPQVPLTQLGGQVGGARWAPLAHGRLPSGMRSRPAAQPAAPPVAHRPRTRRDVSAATGAPGEVGNAMS